MNGELDFKDSCTIYPTTVDNYGKDVLGTPATVPCLFEQNTAYQHGGFQDAVTSASRLVLPADDAFVTSHAYRLEEMIVEVNLFGGTVSKQTCKITSVTVGRDVLLGDQVRHVECDLKKYEGSINVIS